MHLHSGPLNVPSVAYLAFGVYLCTSRGCTLGLGVEIRKHPNSFLILFRLFSIYFLFFFLSMSCNNVAHSFDDTLWVNFLY